MKKEPPFFLKKKFMGGFIATIMILSLAGVFTSNINEKEAIDYNGKWFYPINNGWFTYINNQQIGFQYLPGELENISSTPYVLINSQKVYLITDPDETNISTVQSKQRLASIFYQKNIISVEACSKEESCSETTPIKDCKDIDVPGIYLKSGPTPRIYKDYMCYVVEGDTSLNLYKANEKLIYQILGVVK